MPEPITPPAEILVKDLQATHPTYNAKELLINSALYEGGEKFEAVKNDLLRWREFEKSNLPGGKAMREARLASANYESILSGVFDYFASATLQDPVRITAEGSGSEAYNNLNKGLQATAQELLINSNLHKRAYIGVQFPPQTPAGDLGTQKEAGQLTPRLVVVLAPAVINWDHDGGGKLIWARVYAQSLVNESPFEPATKVRHCWSIMTRDAVYDYEFESDLENGEPKPFKDDDKAKLVSETPHTLNAVPLVEVKLPVYVIDRLRPIAVSLFNRTASMEYSLDASAYQQGWVKTQRPMNQLVVAESTLLKLQDGEEYGYSGPDTQHQARLADDCERLDRNIYKAIQAGALRVTTQDGNTSRMSGVSRLREHGSVAVLLMAYGNALIEALQEAVELVKIGRKEPTRKVCVGGCERFDPLDTDKDLEFVTKLFGLNEWLPNSAKAFVVSKILDAFCYDAPEEVRKQIASDLAALTAGSSNTKENVRNSSPTSASSTSGRAEPAQQYQSSEASTKPASAAPA